MLIKLEHKSARVKGLSFHPTRPWVAASLHSGTVLILDYLRGVVVDSLSAHTGPVRGVCFHPVQEGTLATGGDDYKVVVWDVAQRRPRFTLSGHFDYVRTVEFHHEYPWILSASDDQTIRIWNMQSRACIGLLAGHNHYVMCARFHPREDLVVSASLDQTLRVWDTSGLRKRTVRGGPSDDAWRGGGAGGGGGGGGDASLFTSDALAKYVLEGHDRGVNWACFHPTSPFIASGADDRSVKIWQLGGERAWESATLRGHSSNVSSCVFHPKHELLVSNGEDRSIRVWDYKRRLCLQTFRRDRERYWIMAAHPSKNLLAAGHDAGLLVFKLERERPAYGLANVSEGGVIYFSRDKSLRRMVLGMGEGTDVAVAHMRSYSSTSTFDFNSRPRSLTANQFNRREEQILVHSLAEGGMYELYLANVAGASSSGAASGGAAGGAVQRGAGLAACFLSRAHFVVLDKTRQLAIKTMDNVTTKRVAPPFADASYIFPASTAGRVLVRSEDRLALFETASRRTIGQVSGAKVRYVIWSPNGQRVALLSRTQVTVCDKDLTPLATRTEGVRIKGGAWDENGVFVFATHTHLRYLLPVAEKKGEETRWRAEVGVLRTLDDVLYPVDAKDGVVYCLDRSSRVVSVSFDPTEYLFKAALAAGEYARVVMLIRSGNMCGQALIAYLRRAGFPEVAMQFVEDPDTKLALALECGDLETARACATRLGTPAAWQSLATEALHQGDTGVVEVAYQQIRDLDRLSFLYLTLGRREYLDKMLAIAKRRKDGPAQFQTALFLGDAAERVAVLESTGQLALAFVCASTFGLEEDADRIRGLLEEAELPVPDMESIAAQRASRFSSPSTPTPATSTASSSYDREHGEATARLQGAPETGTTACLPPAPLCDAGTWPHLAVRRSAFDAKLLDPSADLSALTGGASGGGASSGAVGGGVADLAGGDGMAGMAGGDAWGGGLEEDEDGGLGGDMDGGGGEDGLVDGEAGAGWGGDLDLDLGGDLGGGEAGGGGGGGVKAPGKKAGYAAPSPGLGWRVRTTEGSSVAGEHAAAGSMESAMRLLHRQLGIVDFRPMKQHLHAAANATRCSLPTLPSLSSLSPPILDSSPAPPSAPQARPAPLITLGRIEASLRKVFSEFLQGHFGEVEKACDVIFAQLPLCVAHSRAEANKAREFLQATREYKIFVVTERTRRTLSADKKRLIELACYNTHRTLAPPHLLLALRLAMTVSFKNQNFITAAAFARRILEAPEAAAPANAQLQTMARQVLGRAESNGRNEHDIDYDPRNPFDLCCASLKPIYRGSPVVKAPYSGATYHPEFGGKVCIIDRMSLIGEETLGLVVQGARAAPPPARRPAPAAAAPSAEPEDAFDDAGW